jgi:hypothetical protein
MARESGSTEENAAGLLDAVEGEPGYKIITEQETAQDVSVAAYEKEGSNKKEEEKTTDIYNLSEVRNALDKVVNFISVKADKEM